MENKVYFCEDCGMTIFRARKPTNCPECNGSIIGRILTEKDLNNLKN